MVFTGWQAVGGNAAAQTPPDPPQDSAETPPVLPAPVALPLNDKRIALVIPDYQTVEDSSVPVAPMTAAEKWNLG